MKKHSQSLQSNFVGFDRICQFRKESEFKTKSCAVEKAVAVSHAEYENLKRHPLQDNNLIADNTDLIYCDSDDIYHCMMIYDEEQGDGLLIGLKTRNLS